MANKPQKSLAQLEEEVALARLALAEAKKKKVKEDDDNSNVDMVDVKKGKKKDDADEDGDEDEDDEKDDKKSVKKEAKEWGALGGKEPDVKDTDADDEDAKDYGNEHPSDKEVVGEDADEDADDEDEEPEAGKKEKEKDDAAARKDEAKKRSKKLKALMQSYREEDQPPVETVGSPFDIKGKMAESISVIFDGETLTEDFKKKAATVFEAALTSRLNEETAKIEEAAQKALNHAVSEIEEDLMQKADDYVGYVVTEWLEENKLQVERSLRAEIYEGFFDGLKALFVEHNISIPADKLDMLEAKEAECAELTESNNHLTEKLIEKDKAILELKKDDVLAVLSEGLAATQVEKLKALTKDIEAKTVESFKEKVTIIRESFFKETKAPSKKDDGATRKSSEAVDPNIQRYLDAAKTLGQ